jgi:hypothetical protein
MEHVLHLSAGHFIKVVSLTSGHILVDKIKNDNDNLNSSDLEAEFCIGNTIRKSLALVNQVSTI